MKKLTSRDICNLLDILVGATEPYGDTAVDEVREQNLMTLIDIGNWVLDGVLFAADYYRSPMRSMQQIGMRAKSAMHEWQEWLSCRLEELDGRE